MAATPEQRVKAAVKAVLDDLGVWHFSPVSNGMGRHGIPDIVACAQGRFLAIETKREGRGYDTTPLQRQCLDEIAQAGGAAVVISTTDKIAIRQTVSALLTLRTSKALVA